MKEICQLETQWKGCCCDCVYQKEVFKHPWNKNSYAQGSITERMGWICDAPDMGATFMDRKHSFCEMYEKENNG